MPCSARRLSVETRLAGTVFNLNDKAFRVSTNGGAVPRSAMSCVYMTASMADRVVGVSDGKPP